MRLDPTLARCLTGPARPDATDDGDMSRRQRGRDSEWSIFRGFGDSEPPMRLANVCIHVRLQI